MPHVHSPVYMLESPKSDPSAPIQSGPRRRWMVRLFAAIMAGGLLLDNLPYEWTWAAGPKHAVTTVYQQLGLSQDGWGMFAPDPELDNGSIGAVVTLDDGRELMWFSPAWGEVGSGDKFRRFRYINYFNRLRLPENRPAAEDLADYLARTVPPTAGESPVLETDYLPPMISVDGEDDSDADATKPAARHVELFVNSMQMAVEKHTPLPPHDEATWLISSRSLVSRRYEP
ncbi:MAG: hypothetical protein KDA62_07810 [Planctomycetales bacterium]|nr:hypothetical protein [Planctomycetales bacterium]MCA9228648.1 hypothetical protein [Planctomycetales bacterium]